LTARARALDPSRTDRTGRATSRPRSLKPTIREVTRVGEGVVHGVQGRGALMLAAQGL
jgi:hypothetical protein